MSGSACVTALVETLRAHFAAPPPAIVVYSASWSLARAFGQAPDLVAHSLCDALVEGFPGTTVLMPTFTHGFDASGLCDLDAEPSSTGLISETFRRRPGARRTRSAFFSFVATGPERDRLVDLAPREAWGEGSLYHWMLATNAQIVTIGVHPTHCSFSHLVEWRHRDRLAYRFNKTFRGRLRHEGREQDWEETLLVRQRDPSPINDFTWLLPQFLAAGMCLDQMGRIAVSSIGAAAKMAVLDRAIAGDPLAMIKNKEQLFAFAE